jgi:hypothetical protein
LCTTFPIKNLFENIYCELFYVIIKIFAIPGIS